MFLYHRYPYVRILIFYLLGIFWGLQFCNTNNQSFLILFAAAALTVLSNISAKLFAFKFRYLPGLLLGFAISLLGLHLSTHQSFQKRELNISDTSKNYFFQITDEPKESLKSFKILGDIYSLSPKDSTIQITKALIYFAKDSASRALKYGDQLEISLRLKKVPQPQNPYEFNYKRYLANHKIYYQAYAPRESWSFIQNSEARSIKKLAIKIRQHLLKILKGSGLSESEYAVAASILLGQNELLDAETRQDYAGAGAMHVLCVSGLHVGIIYLVFNLLLGFLDRKKSNLLIKTILLIVIIWSYALITGFSASVMRASVMLSFIIIGKASNKKGNIYNSIAASAFLLLLINPIMIMEVGFQLSYAAVIGIVSIYPLLKNHLKHSNKLVDKTYSILIISLAAQIGTFPLAIFYFHQFPFYFLITNLMVVTLASIIINLGFLFLIISGIPLISKLINFAFKYLLLFMNHYVGFIESLPGSTAKALVLNLPEVILIYFLIITLTQVFLKRTKLSLTISLILSLTLIMGFSYRHFIQLNQKNFFVYRIPGHTAFEFQAGKQSALFADSSLISNSQKLNYHTQGNLWHSGIKKPQTISISVNETQSVNFQDLYLFGGQSFLSLSSKNVYLIKQHPSPVDYVIISGGVKYSILKIFQQLKPKLIIFDSSNSLYYEQQIRNEIEIHKIPIYSVNQSGAFILKL